MIGFKSILLKFDRQGEKSGWTYILIPEKIAENIKSGSKKSFRVKGKIDAFGIQAVSLLPMAGGDFIMPVNAAMHRQIKKNKGATVVLELEEDKAVVELSPELMACLDDDQDGKYYFESLPKSHQQYFSTWIESAKTDATKTKRIATAIHAFSIKLSYSQMIRMQQRKET